MIKILLICLFIGSSLLSGCVKKTPTMTPSKHKNQFKKDTVKRYDVRDLIAK